jgi:hypothetical protein
VSLYYFELDELTKGYQDIPIDKIKTILEKEMERSPGSVSVFGLSIPFSIVSKFGVLAIIVVQAYFLLYMVYLYRNFDSEDNLQLEVPWVFMHGSVFSALAFITVSVVYPASIAMYFSWINISSSAMSGWMSAHFVLAMIEIALVVLLIKYILSFRHMKDILVLAHVYIGNTAKRNKSIQPTAKASAD